MTVEAAEPAVERARTRLAALHHVEVTRAVLPHELPPGPFDLIVASDVLYYLPKDVLARTTPDLEAVLAPGGVLLALHHLGEFGQAVTGREVHEILGRRSSLEKVHDETVDGVGPHGAGYAVTIFRKGDGAAPTAG